MKTLYNLLFLVLSGLAFAPAAFGEQLSSSERHLIGVWEEYSPSSNVVQFYPDHTAKLYLTKEEGISMNMHWIVLSWTLSPDNTLTYQANGESQSGELTFKDNEMWIGITKHRQITDIPAKYRW